MQGNVKQSKQNAMPQNTAAFACAAYASILIISALNELSLSVFLAAVSLISVLAIRLALTRTSPHTERT